MSASSESFLIINILLPDLTDLEWNHFIGRSHAIDEAFFGRRFVLITKFPAAHFLEQISHWAVLTLL